MRVWLGMGLVNKVLLALLLLVLLFISVIIAFHINGWVKGVDNLLARSQEAAGNITIMSGHVANAGWYSVLTSQQSLNLTGSATKLVDHATKKIDQIDVDELNRVVYKFGGVADQSVASLDNFDNRLNEVSWNTNNLLWSGRDLLDSSTTFINGPLTGEFVDLRKLTITSNLMATDGQKKLHEILYPPKGNKLVRTFKVIRSAAPLIQPTYFGVRLLKENF